MAEIDIFLQILEYVREKGLETIRMIENESLTYGLTNKVEELLKKDTKVVH